MSKRMNKKAKPLPPLDLLRERLNYDPITGILTWKTTKSSRAKVGSEVGCLHYGYRTFSLDKQNLMVHRVAYYMHTGVDPIGMDIDHINEVKDDNRFCNLRLATPSQNGANQRNVKGFRGDIYQARIGSLNNSVIGS